MHTHMPTHRSCWCWRWNWELSLLCPTLAVQPPLLVQMSCWQDTIVARAPGWSLSPTLLLVFWPTDAASCAATSLRFYCSTEPCWEVFLFTAPLFYAAWCEWCTPCWSAKPHCVFMLCHLIWIKPGLCFMVNCCSSLPSLQPTHRDFLVLLVSFVNRPLADLAPPMS